MEEDWRGLQTTQDKFNTHCKLSKTMVLGIWYSLLCFFISYNRLNSKKFLTIYSITTLSQQLIP